METKEQRLKEYKKALFWFTISRYLPISLLCGTSHGFCLYFKQWSDDLGIFYPELYSLMPNKRCKEDESYWFKPGHKKPRIELLRKAIKMIENDTTN